MEKNRKKVKSSMIKAVYIDIIEFILLAKIKRCLINKKLILYSKYYISIYK